MKRNEEVVRVYDSLLCVPPCVSKDPTPSPPFCTVACQLQMPEVGHQQREREVGLITSFFDPRANNCAVFCLLIEVLVSLYLSFIQQVSFLCELSFSLSYLCLVDPKVYVMFLIKKEIAKKEKKLLKILNYKYNNFFNLRRTILRFKPFKCLILVRFKTYS